MQTIRVLGAAAVVSWAAAASALTGTCQITKLDNPSIFGGGGLVFHLPDCKPAIGFTVDEATGTFTLSRDEWFAAFGDVGCGYTTVGVPANMVWPAGSTTGTIDAAGNVFLPDWKSGTISSVAPERGALIATGLNLFTGPSFNVLENKAHLLEGAPLDFAAKTLRVAGFGYLADAPLAGDTLSGLDLSCTLSAVPDAASLPKAPALAKTGGKVKTSDAGDQLTLKTMMANGATPPVVDGSQPFVLVLGNVQLVVRAGSFTRKGRKLLVVRDDACKVKKGQSTGTCHANKAVTCATFSDCETTPEKLEVLGGRKATSDTKAELGGSLAIAPKGKKGVAIALTLRGLDLSTLASGPLRVAIGSQTARADVTVSGGKLK